MDWYLLLPLLRRPLCLVPRPLAVPTPHLKDPGTPFAMNLWEPFVACFLLSLLLIHLPYAQLLVTFKQPLYYSASCHLWQSLEWMKYFSWTLKLFWLIFCSQCESLATHLPWLLCSELLSVMCTCCDNVFICRSALAAAILSSSLTGQMWAIPPTRLRSFSESSQSDIFTTKPNRGAGIHTR